MHKFLLDEKWVEKFFKKKVPVFFPGKEFLFCRIEPIKIYPDYKVVVVKYNLSIKGKRVLQKKVMMKAGRGLSGKGIKNDYLTVKFLKNTQFSGSVPSPLEYIPLYNGYLYHFIPGYFLQKLSVEKREKEFLLKIPPIARKLKKLHNIEIKKKREVKEENYRRDIYFIKKRHPSISKEVLSWINKKKIDYSPSITHGDFYSRNILINGKKD